MALASTPDLSSYGFGFRWAQQAYITGPSQGTYSNSSYQPSSIRTGNTTPEGNSSTALGAFIIKGKDTWKEYPAYLNGYASSIDGGSSMGGLELKNDANPDGDIEIIFTGLRPGEKLYEELLVDGKSFRTKHPLIYKAKETGPNPDFILKKVDDLAKTCCKNVLYKHFFVICHRPNKCVIL